MSKLSCRAQLAATVAAVIALGIVAGPAGSSTGDHDGPGDGSVPFWPHETGALVGTSETFIHVRDDGSYFDPSIDRRVSPVNEGPSAAATAPAQTSPREPQAVEHARVIRAEINAAYRRVPGRKLVVTEATSTHVVETLTLVTDWLDPRVVAADAGIYFAICPARASCPFPARSAAWPAGAFLPRRQAVELALRTFLETSATLVVVALPTMEPVWVVLERDYLLTRVDASALRDRLASGVAASDAPLQELVLRLTRPHLFVPLRILPVPGDTIYAVPFAGR